LLLLGFLQLLSESPVGFPATFRGLARGPSDLFQARFNLPDDPSGHRRIVGNPNGGYPGFGKSPQITGRNQVGAGDSFSAGFHLISKQSVHDRSAAFSASQGDLPMSGGENPVDIQFYELTNFLFHSRLAPVSARSRNILLIKRRRTPKKPVDPKNKQTFKRLKRPDSLQLVQASRPGLC